MPKHRNQWQEVEGLLFRPKNSRCIFWAFIPRVWFPYSSFQQVRLPSIPSPVEEDTPKIRDTTGTVFIQGPSIVLLVWRSIMFNGSFLRVCRILRFVKKHGVSAECQSIGTSGPWIKTVPVLYHIFDVSSTELGIEGCRTSWKDEYGNHSLGMKAQNMHQLRVLD